MSQNDSNSGEQRPPSYATLCLRAMDASADLLTTTSLASPPPGFLGHTMELFKQRVERQVRVPPDNSRARSRARKRKKSSTLWGQVEIMGQINEVINIAPENDPHGPRQTFEESDADGRWAQFVRDVHRQRKERVWITHRGQVTLSWELIDNCQQKSLGVEHPSDEPQFEVDDDSSSNYDSDLGSDSDDGVAQGSVEDTVQAASPTLSGLHGPGLYTNEALTGAPLFGSASSEQCRICNDENDRPTVEVGPSFGDFYWPSTAQADNDSSENSDEDDVPEVHAAEQSAEQSAEHEAIRQLFRTFPVSIQTTQRVSALDEEYGAAAVRALGSDWLRTEGHALPRRIREHLADLSIAGAPQPTAGPGLGLGLGPDDAHRWLLMTRGYAFVFDMLSMAVWSRPLGQRAD